MKEKNFIDFMLDATESPELTQGFLGIKSKAALKKYFDGSDYKIEAADLEKIWKIVSKLPDVPPWSPSPSPRY